MFVFRKNSPSRKEVHVITLYEKHLTPGRYHG